MTSQPPIPATTVPSAEGAPHRADTPPSGGSAGSVLYQDGVVHSPTDPFAEALVVTDGVVSWLGSQDTVGTLGDVDVAVGLGGALVAPAFVDAHLPADAGWRDAVRARVAQGVGSVHLVVPVEDEALLADVLAAAAGDRSLPDLRVVVGVADGTDLSTVGGRVHALREAAVEAADREGRDGPLVVAVAVDAAHPALEDVVRLASQARLPVRVRVGAGDRVRVRGGDAPSNAASADAQVDRVLAVLRETRSVAGARLELASPVSADRATDIAGAGLGVTVLGLAVAPLAALASAGVPLAFGSGAPVGEPPVGDGSVGEIPVDATPVGAATPDGGPALPASPWLAIRAAVHHPDPAQRVSARAAFRAHTRGGWRAANADHTGAGEIRLGSPAHLAAWDAHTLSVQAPDGRLSAWSTDPRAGTPLLPELSEGVELPACRWVLVAGSPVGQGPGPAQELASGQAQDQTSRQAQGQAPESV